MHEAGHGSVVSSILRIYTLKRYWMTLVLYSISHLGQRLVLLKARDGLDMVFREGGWIWAELGQLSCLCNHSAVLQQLPALLTAALTMEKHFQVLQKPQWEMGTLTSRTW